MLTLQLKNLMPSWMLRQRLSKNMFKYNVMYRGALPALRCNTVPAKHRGRFATDASLRSATFFIICLSIQHLSGEGNRT